MSDRYIVLKRTLTGPGITVFVVAKACSPEAIVDQFDYREDALECAKRLNAETGR